MRPLLLFLLLCAAACGEVPADDDDATSDDDDAVSDDDDTTANDDDAVSDDDDTTSDDDDSADALDCPFAEKLESFPWPYTSTCSRVALWSSDGFEPGLAVSVPLAAWPDEDPDPVGISATVDLSDPNEAWRVSLTAP